MAKPKHPGFFACPHCGAKVRRDAASCRACGSDAETGWSGEEPWDADGGYAADDDFDYDDYVRQEFPDEEPRRLTPWQWTAAAVVVLLVIALLLMW